MASTIGSRPPFYRWVIEALILAMLIVQVMTWLAPAPILEPMIKGVGITLGQAGLIISVIALCIAIFSFAGTFVSARLGTLRTLLVGIWLMGIAEVFSGYTTSFSSLLLCRVIEGVGYGLDNRTAGGAGHAMVRRQGMALDEHGQCGLRIYRNSHRLS